MEGSKVGLVVGKSTQALQKMALVAPVLFLARQTWA